MEQRISLVTLAVEDLERSRIFYEDGLGWSSSFANEQVAFYQVNGFVFGLFDKDAMAEDMQADPDAIGTGQVALAHNVEDEATVDALVEQAEAAGARVLKPPEPTPWGGYSGYIADPDGHPWEIAVNPGWTLHDDGSTTMT